MDQTLSVQLAFTDAPEVRDALSAVVVVGDTLWCANDEMPCLERLSLQGRAADGVLQYGNHVRIALHDYLRLPVAADDDDNEVDVEGLDYHDGYLWLVGSHSLKRKQPKKAGDPDKSIKRLAALKRDANRYLLARIPVASNGELFTSHTLAAQLPLSADDSTLMQVLRDDPHLSPFLGIPGKDNGFDIEGLAVAEDRLFLGLRGPVLRGWAVLLELNVVADDADPTSLRLLEMDEGGSLYRKHFLHLDGLGIRDLCVQGNDLLILAGPTMSLNGPVRVYCWSGGAQPASASLTGRKSLSVVAEIPHGEGNDHAEGIALLPQANGQAALLVVYDNAAESRKRGNDTVMADLLTIHDN